jgi:3-deoxy-D-manno-octulosonic-acid transferase
MKAIYTLAIFIYSGLLHFISPFNRKASLWVKGRKNWRLKLKEKIDQDKKYIWIHCASLGEFEQGRTIIETTKKDAPDRKILLTFFSPSGYEIRKNYQYADHICYLPSDTPGNVSDFIAIVRPCMAIFVKYEFWNNYISVLYKSDIPLYLVSGIFRPGQHFFKWYGGFFREMLKKFTHIFVQDNRSLELLKGIGIVNTSVSGDTRFDRVSQIAGAARDLPIIEKFRADEKLFLAGSSWKPDEEIIARFINDNPDSMKWIFAPHEIDKINMERIEKLLNVKTVKYSEFTESSSDARVMIIDNIGMLSSAYRYAYMAEVGGGFGKGIHNILEASCWGIPVLFGPAYKKFREAVELISMGGAMYFNEYEEFAAIVNKLLTDKELYRSFSKTASDYIGQNTGATEKIITEILGKRY